MDPTINLVKVVSTLNRPGYDREILYPSGYEIPTNERIFPTYEYSINVDEDIKLLDLKSTNIDKEKSKEIANKIGKSVFMNNEAVKLANIDSVFKLSGRDAGLFAPQEDGKFSYLIINAEEGGFHQYLQYRLPICFGYSLSPFDQELNSILDTRKQRLDIIETEDQMGDILSSVDEIISYMKRKESRYLNLVVTNLNGRKSKWLKQLAAQFLVSLNSLLNTGKWIAQIKILDQPTKELIYLISLAFEKITLFKPLMNPDNLFYLIAESPNNNFIHQLNPIVHDIIKQKKYPSSILKSNSLLISYIEYINKIIPLIDESYNLPGIYRYEKALIYWDLPGTPSKEYDFYFRYGQMREGASYPISQTGKRVIVSDQENGPIMITLDDLRKDTMKTHTLEINNNNKLPELLDMLPSKSVSPKRKLLSSS